MSNGNGSSANQDWDVRRHSVTAGDVGAKDRPVWQFMLGGQPLGGKNDLPPFWQQRRDVFLRGSIYRESLWASAVHIAITKVAAQGWELHGESKRTVARWQALLLACDGNQSWVAFMQKQLLDYTCTGNGQFFEIVRASGARGSRIIGLMHLDSLRMTRTGDPQVPFLYRDRLNRLHELKYYQALAMADQPDSSEMWYGVGHCAAERAWQAIRKLSAIETYIYEKVSGRRALAVHIVGGMSETSYRAAVTAAQEEASQKGAVIYMGSTVIPVMGDVAPTLVTIPLASLPDGFNRKEEFDICVLQYADALGIDVQDLQPLSGRAIGTGTQSRVLDDKARGKGLVTWRQQWTHMLNQNIMPDAVTFYFKERDQTEEQRQAAIDETRSNTVTGMVKAGLLIPQQGQQLLVEWDVVPKDLFPQYDTNDKTLADDEKPSPEPTVEQMQQALAQAEQLRQQQAAMLKLQQPGGAGGAGGIGGQQQAGGGGGGGAGGSPGYFNPDFGGMSLQERREPSITRADLLDVVRILVKEIRQEQHEQTLRLQAQLDARAQGGEAAKETYRGLTLNLAAPEIHNHLPPPGATEIHNHMPAVSVPVEVYAPQGATEIHNHLPEQKPPIVTPTINLPETRITVQSASPDVIVQPSLSPSPVIHNHLPDQPPPNVSVVNQVPQTAPASVQVLVPEQAAPQVTNVINVPPLGDRTEEIIVAEHDSQGRISRLIKRIRGGA